MRKNFGTLNWVDFRLCFLALGLFRGSSARFCEVRRTKTLRNIEDAKSRTKWISDYRAFPNRDIEWDHEYLAPLRCVMSYGDNDIID
jgi:hypothetical protein